MCCLVNISFALIVYSGSKLLYASIIRFCACLKVNLNSVASGMGAVRS